MASSRRKKFKRKPVLPECIDFGFHMVYIKEVGSEYMREEAECESDELTPEALWDTDHDMILILENLPTRKKRYYLMHELVHACLDLMDSREK